MRVTQNDPGAHFEKTVDKKEAGFEQFFVNQDRAFALGGGDESDGSHIGRKTGPRGIGNVGDSSAELFFDFERLILGDENILALDFRLNTESSKSLQNHSHVLRGGTFYF